MNDMSHTAVAEKALEQRSEAKKTHSFDVHVMCAVPMEFITDIQMTTDIDGVGNSGKIIKYKLFSHSYLVALL